MDHPTFTKKKSRYGLGYLNFTSTVSKKKKFYLTFSNFYSKKKYLKKNNAWLYRNIFKKIMLDFTAPPLHARNNN